MRTRFQQGLDELREKLLRMGGLAEQAVDRACQAYVERDLNRCHMVMENVVDRMRDEAFIVLVRKMNDTPAVTRQALDALLVARNLERVADHATNIAEDVIFWVRGRDVRHNVEAPATPQPIPGTS